MAAEGNIWKYSRYAIGEIVLVVAGILIALQINNWNEERKIEREMIEVLIGLEAEFEIELERLEDYAMRYDSMVVRASRVFHPTGDENLPEPFIKAGLASVLWAGTADFGDGALESLIASGKMELIKNKELGTSLANWNGIILETQDNEIAMRNFVQREIIPKLAQLGLLSYNDLWKIHDFKYWPENSEPENPFLNKIINDIEFRSLALYRSRWLMGSQREFRATANACRELLDNIRSELKRYRVNS